MDNRSDERMITARRVAGLTQTFLDEAIEQGLPSRLVAASMIRIGFDHLAARDPDQAEAVIQLAAQHRLLRDEAESQAVH